MMRWPVFGFLVLSSCATMANEAQLSDIDLDTSPASLRLGAETVNTVCRGCHDLKYVRFSSLTVLGFSDQEIDQMRGEVPVSAKLMSYMPSAARHTAFGVVPPDLSLIARAREGAGRYIYTLLTRFHHDLSGKVDNALFPGIRMPDIFGIADANADEKADIEGRVAHVAAFLEWAADPHADARHRLGWYVLAYLGILTFLLYRIKRRVWHRLGKAHTPGL